MITTNKKFFDKRNIINNQENLQANQKNIYQRNVAARVNNLQEQCKNADKVFSAAYQAEDQYKQLADRFQSARLDIGYQRFQNAFPFSRKDIIFSHKHQEPVLTPHPLMDLNPIRQFNSNGIDELNQEIQVQINYFECESTSQQSQQSLDQQQSTKQNSYGPRNQSQ